jgi:hypothetical protein
MVEPLPIPERHPLRRLFAVLTERNFATRLGWEDSHVTGYLSSLLTEFAHSDRLYRIRNAKGRRVEGVAELLLEADLLHRASSVERERAVHQHIGDFTLFMAGLFPDYLQSLRTSRRVTTPDALLDHIQAGKRSYAIVSEHCYGRHEKTAPLYRKLSDRFELCVYGLGCVRADLERLASPEYRSLWQTLAH